MELQLIYTILLVYFPARAIYHQVMMSLPSRKPFPFDRPGAYQIKVLGPIALSWVDRLQGMTICPAPEEADLSVTTIEGELSDQAALAGVLNAIYELHLTIVSVQRLESLNR